MISPDSDVWVHLAYAWFAGMLMGAVCASTGIWLARYYARKDRIEALGYDPFERAMEQVAAAQKRHYEADQWNLKHGS